MKSIISKFDNCQLAIANKASAKQEEGARIVFPFPFNDLFLRRDTIVRPWGHLTIGDRDQ
jgi:hypothetical protein